MESESVSADDRSCPCPRFQELSDQLDEIHAERDGLTDRIDGLVTKLNAVRAELADVREAVADEMRANEPAELVTARSQVDYFRELVAEILDSYAATNARGPAVQAQIAKWRRCAGLAGAIVTAGTEHLTALMAGDGEGA